MLDKNNIWRCTFNMTKFTHEFRMQVINERLSGKSFGQLAKKFNIGETTIKQWVHQYNAGGVTQLINVNRRYSTEFKKNVIEYKWEYGLSLNETMSHFKIPNNGTVFQWEKRYLAEGIFGLTPRKKGRQCKMTPEKPKTPKNPRELTREQELEAEIAQLKMENAFLKKLNALVQARKRQQKKS